MTADTSPKKQIFTHSACIAKAMASLNRLELLETLTQGNEVRVFRVGDAVARAKIGQEVPRAESFLKITACGHSEIGVCGTSLDARGIVDTDLVKGGPLRQHARVRCLGYLGQQSHRILTPGDYL